MLKQRGEWRVASPQLQVLSFELKPELKAYDSKLRSVAREAHYSLMEIHNS
jgi:hypothetical protein